MAVLTVLAVAVATAAAVSVPLTVSGSASGHHRALVPAPGDRQPDGQVIGFHGIVVTVPASWNINATRCGTPVADTVIRDAGRSTSCVVRRAGSISSVELRDDPASWTKQMRHVTDVTNDYGVHLRRGTVSGHVAAVVVPAAGVLMFLDTTSDVTTTRILQSVQVVDTDTTGCAMRQAELDPPSSSGLRGGPFRHYTVRYVVPPGASSIAVCHYVDHWLASGATVTGAALAEIVHQANAAPSGLARAPTGCDAASSPGSGFVLHAHYPGQPDLLLWAHLDNCSRVGITDGLRGAQMTEPLAGAIASPLNISP